MRFRIFKARHRTVFCHLEHQKDSISQLFWCVVAASLDIHIPPVDGTVYSVRWARDRVVCPTERQSPYWSLHHNANICSTQCSTQQLVLFMEDFGRISASNLLCVQESVKQGHSLFYGSRFRSWWEHWIQVHDIWSYQLPIRL